MRFIQIGSDKVAPQIKLVQAAHRVARFGSCFVLVLVRCGSCLWLLLWSSFWLIIVPQNVSRRPKASRRRGRTNTASVKRKSKQSTPQAGNKRSTSGRPGLCCVAFRDRAHPRLPRARPGFWRKPPPPRAQGEPPPWHTRPREPTCIFLLLLR